MKAFLRSSLHEIFNINIEQSVLVDDNSDNYKYYKKRLVITTIIIIIN